MRTTEIEHRNYSNLLRFIFPRRIQWISFCSVNSEHIQWIRQKWSNKIVCIPNKWSFCCCFRYSTIRTTNQSLNVGNYSAKSISIIVFFSRDKNIPVEYWEQSSIHSTMWPACGWCRRDRGMRNDLMVQQQTWNKWKFLIKANQWSATTSSMTMAVAAARFNHLTDRVACGDSSRANIVFCLFFHFANVFHRQLNK